MALARLFTADRPSGSVQSHQALVNPPQKTIPAQIEPGPRLEDRCILFPRQDDDLSLADEVFLGNKSDAGLVADLAIDAAVPGASVQVRIVRRQPGVETAV